MPFNPNSLKNLRPFKKGNGGGGHQVQAAYREKLNAALMKTVTPGDVRKIAERLKEDSLAGDIRATHELFDRLFGKAAQPIVGGDGGPVRHTLDIDLSEFTTDELLKFERAATGRSGNDTPPGRN